MEITRAADIYDQLRTLRNQLEQLAGEGRIVMATDDLNKWHSSNEAISAALGGLDEAIAATTWMETLATTDGEYPPLRG